MESPMRECIPGVCRIVNCSCRAWRSPKTWHEQESGDAEARQKSEALLVGSETSAPARQLDTSQNSAHDVLSSIGHQILNADIDWSQSIWQEFARSAFAKAQAASPASVCQRPSADILPALSRVQAILDEAMADDSLAMRWRHIAKLIHFISSPDMYESQLALEFFDDMDQSDERHQESMAKSCSDLVIAPTGTQGGEMGAMIWEKSHSIAHDIGSVDYHSDEVMDLHEMRLQLDRDRETSCPASGGSQPAETPRAVSGDKAWLVSLEGAGAGRESARNSMSARAPVLWTSSVDAAARAGAKDGDTEGIEAVQTAGPRGLVRQKRLEEMRRKAMLHRAANAERGVSFNFSTEEESEGGGADEAPAEGAGRIVSFGRAGGMTWLEDAGGGGSWVPGPVMPPSAARSPVLHAEMSPRPWLQRSPSPLSSETSDTETFSRKFTWTEGGDLTLASAFEGEIKTRLKTLEAELVQRMQQIRLLEENVQTLTAQLHAQVCV